ncbi:hypothetical protein F5984_21595 [Rudanella paleaurantiibacter]|uniref:Thymidylate kinase n=1 Tax=Rudanella paleaurantiibacter TaxID=2614655 RepID=A0A7J5TUR8_9BACT|nr:hypothetical protein [Rudanella paleaurantiibacter]KAB7727663.1 hypothetical protein F5984_21595 [Rudanella paleaurantiibacter]
MNEYRYASDVSRLQAGLGRLGVPLAAVRSATHSEPLPCQLFRNPDGTIRWLWPAGAKSPHFLRFYHPGGVRGRLFVRVTQILFRWGLGRLVAHEPITLYTTPTGAQWLRQRAERWALFTGTAGPNRKLVIWYNDGQAAGGFVKIALAPPAVCNLRREARALRRVQAQPFQQVDVPQLLGYRQGVLVQEDMGATPSRPAGSFTDLPVAGLTELLHRDWQQQPLRDTVFWQQTRQRLARLRDRNDARLPVSLIDKLDRLMGSLDDRQFVPVASAHGDFTPWNVMVRDHRLCVFDWELQHDALPGWYDLFHYVYQSAILVGNRGYGAIRREVDALLSRPEWQPAGDAYDLDTEEAEMLYLIYTVTYYLGVYSEQTDWHGQIHWLLQTWNDALTYWLHRRHVLADRQLLLYDLAFWLHGRPHAALKFTHRQLIDLPESSDLDLCLPQLEATRLTDYLQKHPLWEQGVVESRSFMAQLHVQCPDRTRLHIDLLWRFKRKQIEFMNAGPVWEQATTAPHGLNLPRNEHAMQFIQRFYRLNKAPIPERYQRLYGASEATMTATDELMQIRQMPQNRGWRGLFNRINYAADTLSSFRPRRGLVVTFSGVDGAGKSTVIEQTRYQIEKRLRHRVVVLRHRPSVLPILSAWKYGKQQAEQRAADTLPRQGTNQSRLSSLLRFGYYYADYLFGQFYIQVKYVWRGYIVLYDRYYFDFINDGRRSNINLPKGLARRLYSLLLKPRLNVFLYAPADEILRRKQELDAATITELTDQYLQLFSELQERYPSSEYLPVLNRQLPRTIRLIIDRIQTYSL